MDIISTCRRHQHIGRIFLVSVQKVLLAGIFTTAFLGAVDFAAAQSPQTQQQIDVINGKINQALVDIEAKKLQTLQAKAQPNGARSAQMYEEQIRKVNNSVVLWRQELAMWQQQATFEKQPPSPVPAVQAVRIQIQQLTVEKARLGIQKTQAAQMNNAALATQLGNQIVQRQAAITAKLQEIRLIEMKAKAAAGVPAR